MLACQACKQGTGSEVEQVGLEPTLKWDSRVAGDGFTCYATVPALKQNIEVPMPCH